MTPGRAAGTRKLVLVALLVAGTVGDASSSDAAFPGRNGLIAFASNRHPLLHGEVFALDLWTGRSTNLTRNWATELQPARAPRGDALAFVGRNGIYVMSSAGGGRRLVARIASAQTRVSWVTWSPRARFIAYVLEGGGPQRVFVVPETGGRPVALGACSECDFAWAPDERRLAIVRPDEGLYVVAVGARRGRRIARRGSSPAWSPDGRWVAYQDRGVMIVRPSATGRRRVSRRSASFGWSPRSNALALQSGDGVFLVPLRGRGSRRLGSVPAECRPVWSPNARWISCLLSVLSTTGRKARQIPAGGANLTSLPSWSPGGAKLVYGLALDDSEAASHVYTVHADGSGLRRLTGRGIQEQPHWSPDGLRIAYDCGSSLCVMSADGSAKKRIVSGPIGPGISWLPDGTSLAFVRRGNVWVTGVDGSDLRQLTRTPGDDDESAFQPAWSPDDRWIAYTHERRFADSRFTPCCTETLTVVGSDGGEPRALKANELMAYYPKPAWSPDGRRIAFVDQEGDGFCDDAGTECPPSQLFTIALDGGTVSSVGRLDKRNEFSPAWSPDGKLLAFDNALDIAVMRADGRGRTSLLGAAAAGGTDLAPDWQPRCTLYGTARSERLVGSAGRDVICALGGDDTIDARGGDDVVIGGDGDDRIDGGPGEDRLFGAFGADAIESRDGAVDIVDGGPGTDTATVDPVDAERLVP